MCMGMFGPPYGVPISEEVHQLFPPKVKKAWETFDTWWKAKQGDGPIQHSDMPEDVSMAMQTILEAPIPGTDGLTGAASCYMVGVQSQMED